MSEPSLRSLPSAPLLGAPRARPSQWEAAFAAHYVALCEYVLRFVGSAETAEDIVQDLFLHLWDTRGPRDVLRLTRRYLHVAARNRALKYLRHRRVADGWLERVNRDPTPRLETPEDVCLRRELDAAVQRAIAELPERCRAGRAAGGVAADGRPHPALGRRSVAGSRARRSPRRGTAASYSP